MNNLSPLSATVQQHTDVDGRQLQLVIAKGVWRLNGNTLAERGGELTLQEVPTLRALRQLSLSPAQQKVVSAQLDEEIEWLPSDCVPPKAAFDFLVCGYAHAPEGKARLQFSASVAWEGQAVGGPAGESEHTLRIHAPRYWRPTLLQGGGAVPGEPLEAVQRVPLHPRFAFGGATGSARWSANPMGMGAINPGDDTATVAMPWLERSGVLSAITARHSNPQPAAFGPWTANAEHRARHAGTYDAAWKRERAPLPPVDFSPRFYNQADPQLQWPRAPEAGSVIRLTHLTRRGIDQLRWPALQPVLDIPGGPGVAMRADTCVVSTEEESYAIVWRALAPLHHDLTLRVQPL